MLSVEIVNDGTGTQLKGNYRYRVLVNGREIAAGEVRGHYRPAGWGELLLTVAKQAKHDEWLRSMAEVAEACLRYQEENRDAR